MRGAMLSGSLAVKREEKPDGGADLTLISVTEDHLSKY